MKSWHTLAVFGTLWQFMAHSFYDIITIEITMKI
nr:MAG TPA: hypothetical protein [Caudoviricetes sp.]